MAVDSIREANQNSNSLDAALEDCKKKFPNANHSFTFLNFQRVQKMFRKHSAVIYVILIVVGLIGAWLTGLFEGAADRAHEVSRGELLAAFLGFFLFVGALLGIVLLIRRSMTPLTQEQLSQWERIRARGRAAYIGVEVVKGFIAGFLALTWPLISDYRKTGSLISIAASLWIYIPLFLTCVFVMYYGAIRTWNLNEKEYKARSQQ